MAFFYIFVEFIKISTQMKLNNIILIPTDFSEVCHNAIDHGVKIAGSQKGMKVFIYHVINKDTHAYFKGADNLNKAVQEKLQGLIDEFQLNHHIEMEYATKREAYLT